MRPRERSCWMCVPLRNTGRDILPGSKNIPLYVINKAEEVISLDTPHVCLLSQRSKKPGGGLHAGENGVQ